MRIFILAIALGAIPAIAAAQSTGAGTPAAATEAAPAAASPAAATTPEDAARKEMREKFRMACGADVAKFCADTEKGRGKKRACLEQHQSEISATCKGALADRAAARS